jgi:hypothetical protein
MNRCEKKTQQYRDARAGHMESKEICHDHFTSYAEASNATLQMLAINGSNEQSDGRQIGTRKKKAKS